MLTCSNFDRSLQGSETCFERTMRDTLLFQQLLSNFFILSFGKVPFLLHHPIYSHPFPLLILREDKIAFVWPARYYGAVRKTTYATGGFHYVFYCMHNGPRVLRGICERRLVIFSTNSVSPSESISMGDREATPSAGYDFDFSWKCYVGHRGCEVLCCNIFHQSRTQVTIRSRTPTTEVCYGLT